MRIAVTGASGFVGHWIAAHLLDAGHDVVALGRRPSQHAGAEHRAFALGGDAPDLSGVDGLVHCAFSHVPGRYRGGEGDDPEGFRRLNLDGSVALFEATRRAGVARALFLSSRAVYGDYPAGTTLTEDLPPRPDSLYGVVKHESEQALSAMASPTFSVASLRATGVYGPPVAGLPHKWAETLAAFDAGQAQSPRAGTEVHAADLAEAIRLLAEFPTLPAEVFNVSDITLDRRDMLARYAQISGRTGPLPDRADATKVSAMSTDRLAALGWRPRGPAGIDDTLRALISTG